jgi:hypothetical protein
LTEITEIKKVTCLYKYPAMLHTVLFYD